MFWYRYVCISEDKNRDEMCFKRFVSSVERDIKQGNNVITRTIGPKYRDMTF